MFRVPDNLAAVKDLATMEIVGWSMSERLKSVLCEEALKMAIRSRRLPMGLIHHSDRGVQYACGDYRKLLRLHESQTIHPIQQLPGSALRPHKISKHKSTLAVISFVIDIPKK